MSSLGRALEKQNLSPASASDASPSHSQPLPSLPAAIAVATAAPARPACLEVIINENDVWEIPWASFYGANIKRIAMPAGDARERLVISFLRFDVVVEGAGLARLRKTINDMSLVELRQVARGYHEFARDGGQLVVSAITVVPASRETAFPDVLKK